MSSFIDLTHHLSPEARRRRPNPLKDIIRISLENPHLVNLANGDPHPSLYPIRQIDFHVAPISEGDSDPVAPWRALGSAAPTQAVSTARDAALLRRGLQYGHGAGLRDTRAAVEAVNARYHGASAHVATMTLGNSDAIAKCFRLLGAPGDTFLAEEYTFAVLAAGARAHGVRWEGVRMDKGGMVPEELERILETWDPRRGRRPHVLYTIPCGQNPTGTTLSLERREKIYDIARRYDIVIMEDDPYYFLQYSEGVSDGPAPLAKSFLAMDVDGRVIRIDSFSKIMAPGMRLGWITSSPAFQEQLVNLTDTSTQNPHAFGQVLVTQLLGPGGWGLEGFDRWVRGLRGEYERRRDLFMEHFDREVARTGLASAETPVAGMFVWVRVHVAQHPRFDPAYGGGRTNTAALMEELFEKCIAGGLLMCPARIFVLPAPEGETETEAVAQDILDRTCYVRGTFAGSEEAMKDGLAMLGKVLVVFFA